MGHRPRRLKPSNPMEPLRRVSKDIKKTEEQWKNEFATRNDVVMICEKMLDRYDELVMERWWWRAKVPVRWVRARALALRDWIKRKLTRTPEAS